MQAIRNKSKAADRSRAEHAGLVLRHFLQDAVPATGAPREERESHQRDRRQLHLDVIRAAAACRNLYQQAFQRETSQLPIATVAEIIPTQGRLIVGLGGDNVLETGITLHHTYGVPIIPGSALKGLAAHFCDQIWGNADSRFKRTKEYHEILFGTTDDSGHITFHDGWITPDSLRADGTSGLVLDVMTPHHSDYYSGETYKAGPKNGELIPPTDFDDPNPVTFLSVAGAFHVAVSCDVPGEAGDHWAKLAFGLLKEALREWGVGGKTSSGYGRLMNLETMSSSSGESSQSKAVVKPTTPVHKPREKVTVTQRTIEGKLRYEAKDGFLGSLIQGTPPALADGETTDLWVQRVDEKNKKVPYVFQVDEPVPPKSQPPRKSSGRGPRQ